MEESSQEYTIESLREYDGIKRDRILLAVSDVVYDVTAGKQFYGKGGPYAALAGRDATRGLCLFEVIASDEPIDASALTDCERESLEHWSTFYAGI
ncbi:hypothetical protein CAPTEDRAFT_117808 [Capitella teleta]|uniref:Cytochrome b5 heme-binding domain-containing protein n=1 Tax=Capitella teleta TaxID=283909 RepID=R7UN18_CAPTE|nr:hypothetical protein CAPTEDRAFT_117808 [Capitella teleta]|eukprot:ELU07585.1 hypothetical protein CAPTEDRAFT_117808 [Capitella teleta]